MLTHYHARLGVTKPSLILATLAINVVSSSSKLAYTSYGNYSGLWATTASDPFLY